MSEDTHSEKSNDQVNEQYLKEKFKIQPNFTNQINDSIVNLSNLDFEKEDKLVVFEVPHNFDINKLKDIKIKAKDLQNGKRKKLISNYIYDLDNNIRETSGKVIINKENGKLAYYNVSSIAKVLELLDEPEILKSSVLSKKIIKHKNKIK